MGERGSIYDVRNHVSQWNVKNNWNGYRKTNEASKTEWIKTKLFATNGLQYIYANKGVISIRSLAEKLNYSESKRTFRYH